MSEDYTRPPEDRGDNGRTSVNARQLWTGGAATALVAALVGLVAVVVMRGVLRIPVLGPSRYGTLGDVSTARLCLFAALAALLATALVHLLLVTTPRPHLFFGWIVTLATVAVAVRPFTTDAALQTQVASCALNVVIGLAIGTLVTGVAAGASRPRR
ncbi:hypothetical protein SAMN04487820_104193 [Actinopolyspora mzabensis]|uniref:Uncharacterized protein n=1 Tax=Actinopolyspora mzabensis TaxID=995066 RepID=A0A1G8Z2D5_ACTMZ|nr:DUF6069 family protein [Actinopolyspora mzabensis]SDK09221.1 hypothetical protein SAMN04487820_104193 [Actinopolyspora mzabensis]